MARAYSPKEILAKKFDTIQWSQKWESAFGKPESVGLFFISGNSTNGKTAFVVEMAKELGSIKKGKVFYNSLEEGNKKTMQNVLMRAGVNSTKSNIIIGCEELEELDIRLSKQKSPHTVIIDSVQLLNVRIPRMRKFIEKYKNTKLLIFISQVTGTMPKGKTADDIKYISDQKIWIEGFIAFSQGRHNSGGRFVIWQEGATKYWEQKNKEHERKAQ
jgi:DnaB-like helicase C terminal domain